MKLMRMLPAVALVAGIAVPGSPTQAVIDLTEVEVTVAIEGIQEASDSPSRTVTARVVVSGTGIAGVTITPPGGTAVSLPAVSGDFVLERSFADETTLNASLPAGSYVLAVQGADASETATATLAYERPEVTSPAISQPAHRSTVRAGSLAAEFASCPVCVLTDDSTVATLEQGGTSLASETLEGTDTEWTPSDDAGPLELDETSSFTLRVVHTASRSSAATATPSDAFTFTSVFSRSDEVEFSTGFQAPEGNVCLVVNDPALQAAGETCTLVEDSLLGILDVSGSDTVIAAGIPVGIGLTLGPNGALSGIAAADLDGDGAGETSVPARGRLRGSGGRLRQNVRFALEGGASSAGTSLRVSILERTLLSKGLRTRKQTTKGDLRGAPLSETTEDAESLGDPATGWRLDFPLSGDAGRISGATLRLSNGRSVALTGRHRFVFELDRTNVRLASGGGDEGVKIEANGLRFDDAGRISRGEIRWRAFGQGGRVRFRAD
jgi:hypothetical protein